MRRQHKRWGAAGAALLLLGVVALFVVLFVRSRTGPQRFGHESPEEVADRWRGFAAGTPGLPAAEATPDAAVPAGNGWLAPLTTPAQLESAVDAWRHAVEDTDLDTVQSLNHVFMQLPGRYGPELEKLAVSDPNERVRAFSARVLGQAKNPALTDLFRRFLGDPSPFVRQNGAWSLGELAQVPEGRQAAQAGVSELQQLGSADPNPDVRASAMDALKKLQ